MCGAQPDQGEIGIGLQPEQAVAAGPGSIGEKRYRGGERDRFSKAGQDRSALMARFFSRRLQKTAQPAVQAGSGKISLHAVGIQVVASGLNRAVDPQVKVWARMDQGSRSHAEVS